MGSIIGTKCKCEDPKDYSKLIKAEIYLRAVLPTLTDLVELDTKAKEIIGNKKIKILFNLRNGSRSLISIENGAIKSVINPPDSADIHLFFVSPEHAIGVFEQGKLPIILKGIFKISFLRNEFDSLSKRLEYFLKPSGTFTREERKISVLLQFKFALRAGEVLGELEPTSQAILKNTPPGILMIKVEDIGAEAYFGNIGGKWRYIEKPDDKYKVTSILSLKNLETAEAMLVNKLDTFSALGLGNMRICGLIPLIDNVGLVLGRINLYVS